MVGLRYLEELGHLTIAQIRSLKVRPYPFSKTSRWCITGLRNKNGKRARLFFRTKSDATGELDRIKIKFRDAGEKALEVTDELRLAALGGQTPLSGGKSIHRDRQGQVGR